MIKLCTEDHRDRTIPIEIHPPLMIGTYLMYLTYIYILTTVVGMYVVSYSPRYYVRLGWMGEGGKRRWTAYLD